MADPQAGIIPEPSQNALFLILRVGSPSQDCPAVARAAAQIPAFVQKLSALDRRAKLVCTVSFGPEFWDAVSPRQRPRGLRPFKALAVDGRRAPNSGGDLLLHILSKRHDLNFELAMRVRKLLGNRVVVMDEVHGFRYLESRDLIGFMDGTENPKGKERAAVALIGDEDRQFAGGSFVFTQRYVHDLDRWEALSTAAQEDVVGRRKRDSKELSDKRKPPTAHVSRVVIEEDGAELQIVRHSFPYGTVTEAGLFFIAYSKTIDTFEKMLSRMMGASGDGVHDHLMDFTRPLSGATFFAPSLRVLKTLGLRGSS